VIGFKINNFSVTKSLTNIDKGSVLFSFCRDVKVSKREAIFRSPRTEKEEHADAIFRPYGWKSVLTVLFSIPIEEGFRLC